MMAPFTSLVALAFALQAQPAATGETAETAADQSTETTETQAKDKSRIICRRTAIVGSKFKKKVCGTKEEWAALARRGRGTTSDLQRRGRGLDPNGN